MAMEEVEGKVVDRAGDTVVVLTEDMAVEVVGKLEVVDIHNHIVQLLEL